MNRILLILILTLNFQTSTIADDIKDFELEGMSVGDSLLNFFTTSEIKKKISSTTTYWYADDKYVSVLIQSQDFKVYDEVGVVFNPNDKKFILQSIEGTFNYRSKINECYKKQKTITTDLKKTFSNNSKFVTYTVPYTPDKTGKSISKNNRFKFSNGSAITVICYDMDEDFVDPNDQLYLAISSSEFIQWVNR